MNIKNNQLQISALLASAILLLLLLVNSLCRGLPHAPLIFGIAIILYEILVPLEIVKWFNLKPRDLNIYAHNIDAAIDWFLPPFGVKKTRPDFSAIKQEFIGFAIFTLLIFIPYVVGYWLYFKLEAISAGDNLFISFNLPPKIHYEIIIQIFVVALPEELFYRGFLQSALLKKWPNKTFIFGLPLGRAIVFTNIIFALGHVVGTWAPTRLLTFFPGILFSYLVYRNKSLLSAILFHAACNILGQILYASIFLR